MRGLVLALLFVAPVHAANVRLTIVAAKIDGAKLQKRSSPVSNAHLSDLACLSLPGLRALHGFCGGAGDANGAPVDAFVRVEIGEHVVRTYPVPGSLTPEWQYGVVLDKQFLGGDDFADFILYDYDAAGTEKKLGDNLIK